MSIKNVFQIALSVQFFIGSTELGPARIGHGLPLFKKCKPDPLLPLSSFSPLFFPFSRNSDA